MDVFDDSFPFLLRRFLLSSQLSISRNMYRHLKDLWSAHSPIAFLILILIPLSFSHLIFSLSLFSLCLFLSSPVITAHYSTHANAELFIMFPKGFDLFLLEGYPSIGGLFPKRYTRLQNWPNGIDKCFVFCILYLGNSRLKMQTRSNWAIQFLLLSNTIISVYIACIYLLSSHSLHNCQFLWYSDTLQTHLFTYLYLCPSHGSVYLPAISIHLLSACITIYSYITSCAKRYFPFAMLHPSCMFIYLFIYLSILLLTNSFIHLFNYLFVHLSIYLFVLFSDP